MTSIVNWFQSMREEIGIHNKRRDHTNTQNVLMLYSNLCGHDNML